MTSELAALGTARLGKFLRFTAAIAVFASAALLTGGWFSRAAEDKEPEIPAPEDIVLETKEEPPLLLKCTWYAGWKEKNSVPILMLHGYGESRKKYQDLALYMQQQGHAVLVPDLRGHGGSTRYQNGDRIKHDELKPADFGLMMTKDIERCKKFLMEKHNAGELNIEMLCVVASEMSTVLAMNWAVSDWSWPQTPSLKQGQDVKALILLSPKEKIEKTPLNVITTLKHYLFTGRADPRLSILIAVGSKKQSALSEAKKILDPIKRARPDPKEDVALYKDLFFETFPTELQGTELLNPKLRLGIEEKIRGFIKLRLVDKKNDYKWESREPPK